MSNDIKKILSLMNYFILKDNDFKIFSIKLFFEKILGTNNILDNLFWTHQISLKIIFPIDIIKFYIEKEYINIPIFPPLNSIYGELYIKILEIYGNTKIDFIVVSREDYEEINYLDYEGFKLTDYNFFIKKMKQEIDFKLSQIEKTSFFGFKDIYRHIILLSSIYKFFKKNDYSDFLSETISFFQFLEQKFGREFYFQSGNKKVCNYKGIARFLYSEKLMTSNEIFNFFEEGNIILAENTSVSYMKYILKAGGIITMNNNILSHASIVSRELGIPLVLGADFLFLKIFDGDLIKINSRSGEIMVLKRFWEYV